MSMRLPPPSETGSQGVPWKASLWPLSISVLCGGAN